MIKRLATLQAILLLGLGSIFLLPKKIEIQPAAIAVSLPAFVGNWYGTDKAVSQREKDVLGTDTQILRKLYTSASGDQIFVTIVFSGPDMANSIHRPERCLPTQGWTVVDTTVTKVPIGKENLATTRLFNLRNFRNGNAPSVTVYSLDYYWFVGHEDQTPSHLERTWI